MCERPHCVDGERTCLYQRSKWITTKYLEYVLQNLFESRIWYLEVVAFIYVRSVWLKECKVLKGKYQKKILSFIHLFDKSLIFLLGKKHKPKGF